MNQDWNPVVLRKTSPKIVKVSPKEEKEDGFIEVPKTFTVEFGQRVQKFRAEMKLRRVDLAQKLMVKESVVENIEKGKELYSGAMLSKLKKILGNDL